jgi:aspartate aminotransferase
MTDAVSREMSRLLGAIGPFAEWSISLPEDRPCDFLFGNPHEVAPPAYVDALLSATRPTGTDHYAYKMNEAVATQAVAAGLRARFGLPFQAEDVCMTNGNFAGLAIVLRTLVDPGDEVIYISPPWFFYETLILAAGATPVRVYADPVTFDLDLDAIAAAMTSRTRAIIVNSPHNPSGRIYPPEMLDALGGLLAEASARNGRPVYLLSDEAYNRILFDGKEFPTPIAHYPHAFMLYTYAKTLLSPGSRLGYIALGPSMPEREELRVPLLVAQIATGWAFPVAPLQYALPELERLGPDLGALQTRRDRVVSVLRAQGYEVVEPEATFYVLVRSPLQDDRRFADLLAARGVFVLPGAMFEMSGWLRISLTASDDMVERAIPGFAAALAEAAS